MLAEELYERGQSRNEKKRNPLRWDFIREKKEGVTKHTRTRKAQRQTCIFLLLQNLFRNRMKIHVDLSFSAKNMK